MADVGMSLPPVPPMMPAGGVPGGAPSFGAGMANVAGMGQPSSPGVSQMSGAVVRLGMEIDQALKLLAQTAPMLSPFVERVVTELRFQIAQALQSGVSASPESPDDQSFPDGGGRL